MGPFSSLPEDDLLGQILLSYGVRTENAQRMIIFIWLETRQGSIEWIRRKTHSGGQATRLAAAQVPKPGTKDNPPSGRQFGLSLGLQTVRSAPQLWSSQSILVTAMGDEILRP